MPSKSGWLCFFDPSVDKKDIFCAIKRKVSLENSATLECPPECKKSCPQKELGDQRKEDTQGGRRLTRRLERIRNAGGNRSKRKGRSLKIRKNMMNPSQMGYSCDRIKESDMCSSKDKDLSVDDSDGDSGIVACERILQKSYRPKSNYVALDCEFVGVGPEKTSALARCSIVNYDGEVLCDIYVCPKDPITDYRTPWSGITKKHLRNSIPFENARNSILPLIQGKIVVGHALHNDFSVMGISHPQHLIRDTARCAILKRQSSLKTKQAVSLKRLSLALLGRSIQCGRHCSVEDARAAMSLYRLVENEWEAKIDSKSVKRGVKSNITVLRHRSESECSLESASYFDDNYWPHELLATS